MLRSLWLLGCLWAIGLATVPGCDRSGPPQWEVAVENKNDTSCSCLVTLGPDGGTKAKVDGIAKGGPIRLIAGPGDTVVHTVKVTRGTHEQVLTPGAPLPAGKRYLIVVAVDGKVEASVVNK
jgi:hypothetical protein